MRRKSPARLSYRQAATLTLLRTFGKQPIPAAILRQFDGRTVSSLARRGLVRVDSAGRGKAFPNKKRNRPINGIDYQRKTCLGYAIESNR